MFLILPNCSAGTSKSEQRGMRRFAALSNKKSKSTMAAANKSPGGKRDYDYLFKLVLIGDSGVGKSCLLLRFAVSSQKFWHRRIGASAYTCRELWLWVLSGSISNDSWRGAVLLGHQTESLIYVVPLHR